MPAVVQKHGGLYRVVEKYTSKLVRNKAGTPVDGGGFTSLKRAQKQANAINMSQFGMNRASRRRASRKKSS